MLIEFTKRADGRTVLRCLRADGSVTWQRNDDRNARFFPLHDLTHYAVETELGFSQGFFGLIAKGWNIDETTGQTARGALPNEALEVEYIVSAFSAERAAGAIASAAEFNQLARTFASAKGMPPPRPLSDEDLVRVRSRFDELAAKWRSLQPDETLELTFALL
ncbi:MAG: hypothetical protein DME97_16025 [Verrucomicrobia bacterium]|nr:MAG: hypothetical protein DME97_16025 [Verrucomicrobiota bacterium]